MDRRVKTLIVDDHPVFRHGLRQIIERDHAFDLVGEAADGEAGMNLATQTQAEVVVLDVSLPRMNGLEVARRLQERKSRARVVILTMHKEETLFNQAMNLDVKGYLLKDTAVTDILHCLRAVAAGEYYVSPSLSAYLLHRRERTNRLAGAKPGLHSLTAAERRVLKGIAANQTSKQIARDLGISHRTVEAHRTNICTKLDLRGSHCLLHFGLQNSSALNDLWDCSP
jgi:DNA-binding NarL/FixJ family response regulator